MQRSLFKEPSAAAALAMATAAMGLVYGHAAVFGVTHQTDEGTPAHIFQLLMVAQVPFVAHFAMKWLPEAPKDAMKVLGLQVAVIIAAFAGVYFLT
ncbi:MAG: hypothetical protein ABIQ55_06385 [Gemmatimonadaceae bacterium]